MESSVSPETPSLGGLLRRLRRDGRWTQDEAARAAGIGRVTLVRWEKDEQRPRLPELEALLAALGAGAAERRRALGLLETPGAQAQTRAEVRRLADRTGLGGLPSGGDLLRALRLRQGLAAEEAAARAGMRVWALRRWEAGETWPDVARLHALCWALGAHEEEVVALTVGPFARLAPPGDSAAARPQDLNDQMDALFGRIAAGDYALMDLHCLTLQARAWPLATQSSAGRRLLSRAYFLHATSLSFRGRPQEAKRRAEHAMTVWPPDYRRDTLWYYCGVLVAQGFSGGGGGEASGAPGGAGKRCARCWPLSPLTRTSSGAGWRCGCSQRWRSVWPRKAQQTRRWRSAPRRAGSRSARRPPPKWRGVKAPWPVCCCRRAALPTP